MLTGRLIERWVPWSASTLDGRCNVRRLGSRYHHGVSGLLRSVYEEPRAPHAPARSLRDWCLLGVLLVLGLVEVLARPELDWSSPGPIVSWLAMPAVLWRRSRPLIAVAIGFGAATALDLLRLRLGGEPVKPHALAHLLVLAYALFRWGSGRERFAGLALMVASASVGSLADRLSVGEWIGAFAVLISPMALAAAVRSRDRASRHQLQRARLEERHDLARDLHDTVAHHVSAIAVRAQAGLATSSADPANALDALRDVESEARRALEEMRSMVGVLRRDEPGPLAPQPRIRDLASLAGASSGRPEIDMTIAREAEELSPTLSAAVYRLAQESITNALRHARRATRIEVEVSTDAESVRLVVRDDGEAVRRGAVHQGFGLAGMRERAELLGGTCSASPGPDGGWTVMAVLPRSGALG